jgi:hypothetical protein
VPLRQSSFPEDLRGTYDTAMQYQDDPDTLLVTTPLHHITLLPHSKQLSMSHIDSSYAKFHRMPQ